MNNKRNYSQTSLIRHTNPEILTLFSGPELANIKQNEERLVELGLMDAAIDGTELADAADALVQTFQADAAREAGIFHHLITLPTYHTAALSTDTLTEGYFGDLGMLAYVRDVQRKEIRGNLAAVKHQDLAGSNIGDDHKEYFLGEKALLAGGAANTMNQF